MKIKAIALCCFIFSAQSWAHNIQLNTNLPAVTVQQDGELNVVGDQIQYRPWHSANLVGKVRVLQHIAGRSSAKEKNAPLIDAIKAAHFDRSQYQTTTIVNADDAIIGTGHFVKSSVEQGKKENAHSQVVLDQKSTVKNAWQLREKESLIVVLDKNGKVQFVAEGKLSPTYIQEVITLVNQLIKK